jgi:hypothetical protein
MYKATGPRGLGPRPGLGQRYDDGEGIGLGEMEGEELGDRDGLGEMEDDELGDREWLGEIEGEDV